LIAARALQALGTSGALVLARVIVRDLYEGSRAGRELSVMAMMAGSMPIVAPLIGGVLQHTFGWRSAFAVILAGGVLATTMVWRFLPETTRRTDFEPLSVGELVGNYWIVGRNRIFLAHAGIAMASYAGLFAYISGASFVIQDLYGLTPLAFSVFLSVTASGYMIGSFVAARTVERAGLDRTIGAGALALAGGGAAMLVSVALFPQAPAAIALPMMLYVAGLGLAAPAAFAGAMQPFPGRAGAASSLVGCIQQTASAVAGAIVGHLIGNSAWPFVISIAAMGCLSLALWWLTRTIRTARLAHGEPSAPRK
jgi:DHA1 family bicyclomycin/chloramphenicol resistance-like MFS transporter